jgi:hypothetical protein
VKTPDEYQRNHAHNHSFLAQRAYRWRKRLRRFALMGSGLRSYRPGSLGCRAEIAGATDEECSRGSARVSCVRASCSALCHLCRAAYGIDGSGRSSACVITNRAC